MWRYVCHTCHLFESSQCQDRNIKLSSNKYASKPFRSIYLKPKKVYLLHFAVLMISSRKLDSSLVSDNTMPSSYLEDQQVESESEHAYSASLGDSPAGKSFDFVDVPWYLKYNRTFQLLPWAVSLLVALSLAPFVSSNGEELPNRYFCAGNSSRYIPHDAFFYAGIMAYLASLGASSGFTALAAYRALQYCPNSVFIREKRMGAVSVSVYLVAWYSSAGIYVYFRIVSSTKRTI